MHAFWWKIVRDVACIDRERIRGRCLSDEKAVCQFAVVHKSAAAIQISVDKALNDLLGTRACLPCLVQSSVQCLKISALEDRNSATTEGIYRLANELPLQRKLALFNHPGRRQ